MSEERTEFRFLRPPEVRGLTPALVADTFDITRKWGQVDVDDQLIRFQSGNLGLGYELITSARMEPGSPEGLLLIVAKSAVPLGGMVFIRTDQGIVMWHRQLTSEEAQKAVSVIDQNAKKAGLISETGERKALSPEHSVFMPEKYKTEEVFRESGSSFLVPPGEDPEKYLNRFDRPDDLTIVGMPGGGFSIIKKDQLPYLQRRAQIVHQILAERGININDPSLIGKLSAAEILRLREEIQRRLNQE